ncbi:MAG TPA: hypothetical protein VFQ80_02860 [Thermomicrobiales bacterium]|jgi:uncharacterized protein (DUF697 family)|nr:hypothetical protein [Thermomicrobiales bacterium]
MEKTSGGVFALRHLMTIVREVSFDDLRQEATTPPRVLILAPDPAAGRELGMRLVGPGGEGAFSARGLDAHLGDAGQFDVVVVYDPERTGATARTEDHLRLDGIMTPVVKFAGLSPSDETAIEHLRAAIVKQVPARAPAFGRALPSFRPAATKAVIDDTALANAQFALVSNIPSIVPIVGSLASAGADLIVLTKNQVMMIFKLAAINGKDLHDQIRLLQEVAPVIGAGFVWRTAAREMASFLPFAAGTIPKVAVAYVGTVTIGRAADVYYRTNRKPTREQLDQFRRQALDAARRLPLPKPGRKADGAG